MNQHTPTNALVETETFRSAYWDRPPVERRMPPGPRGTVEILRSKGHIVHVREDRNGSLRYEVDGGAWTDALTMTNRFRHYGL